MKQVRHCMNCGARVGLNSPLCDDCSGQTFDEQTGLYEPSQSSSPATSPPPQKSPAPLTKKAPCSVCGVIVRAETLKDVTCGPACAEFHQQRKADPKDTRRHDRALRRRRNR